MIFSKLFCGCNLNNSDNTYPYFQNIQKNADEDSDDSSTFSEFMRKDRKNSQTTHDNTFLDPCFCNNINNTYYNIPDVIRQKYNEVKKIIECQGTPEIMHKKYNTILKTMQEEYNNIKNQGKDIPDVIHQKYNIKLTEALKEFEESKKFQESQNFNKQLNQNYCDTGSTNYDDVANRIHQEFGLEENKEQGKSEENGIYQEFGLEENKEQGKNEEFEESKKFKELPDLNTLLNLKESDLNKLLNQNYCDTGGTSYNDVANGIYQEFGQQGKSEKFEESQNLNKQLNHYDDVADGIHQEFGLEENKEQGKSEEFEELPNWNKLLNQNYCETENTNYDDAADGIHQEFGPEENKEQGKSEENGIHQELFILADQKQKENTNSMLIKLHKDNETLKSRMETAEQQNEATQIMQILFLNMMHLFIENVNDWSLIISMLNDPKIDSKKLQKIIEEKINNINKKSQNIQKSLVENDNKNSVYDAAPHEATKILDRFTKDIVQPFFQLQKSIEQKQPKNQTILFVSCCFIGIIAFNIQATEIILQAFLQEFRIKILVAKEYIIKIITKIKESEAAQKIIEIITNIKESEVVQQIIEIITNIKESEAVQKIIEIITNIKESEAVQKIIEIITNIKDSEVMEYIIKTITTLKQSILAQKIMEIIILIKQWAIIQVGLMLLGTFLIYRVITTSTKHIKNKIKKTQNIARDYYKKYQKQEMPLSQHQNKTKMC